MAVAASSLIEPAGPLTTSLFPNEDIVALGARVTAYLTAAATDARVVTIIAGDGTKADAAKRSYALWRAYSAATQRMISEPLQVNITEKGSHGYSMAQIAAMQALADSYDAALEAILPASTAPIASSSIGVRNVYGW